ncbi:transmembrane protein [Flavobacterium enshiense DK69]|nr:transmembrane protein [Flavobacterium enshiense DK69]
MYDENYTFNLSLIPFYFSLTPLLRLFFYLCALLYSLVMGFIDIVLAAFLVFGLIKGIRNGLFVEIASLISLFIGIYLAIKFSYVARSAVGSVVSWSPKTIQVTAFILTLIAVVVAIHLLAKVLSGVANMTFMGWLNTIGGGLFATIKTILLLGVVLCLFQKVNINNMMVSKETQDESLLFNPILKTSEFLLPVLTDWFNNLKEGAIKSS